MIGTAAAMRGSTAAARYASVPPFRNAHHADAPRIDVRARLRDSRRAASRPTPCRTDTAVLCRCDRSRASPRNTARCRIRASRDARAVMPRVDRRRRKPAVGERPHEREKLFLPASGAVEKDDGRPAILRRRGCEEDAGHPLARFGREGEVLGAIRSRIDARLRLRRKRHARPRRSVSRNAARMRAASGACADATCTNDDGNKRSDEQHAVTSIRSLPFFAFP